MFAGQKAVNDYCRCFADPPGKFWRRSINHAPHATPNSRDGTGRDAAFRTKPAQQAGTPLSGATSYPLFPLIYPL